MSAREKIFLVAIALAVVAMVVWDRMMVKSGSAPLLAEESARLNSLGDMVVGMSGNYNQPTGAYYMSAAMPWSWPLPSMLPVASGQ